VEAEQHLPLRPAVHVDQRGTTSGAGGCLEELGVDLDAIGRLDDDRLGRDQALRRKIRRQPMMGGSWSAYWYNGVIVSSEIARGLDVYELMVNPLISANELAAAKTVKVPYWNTQDQQKFVWPQTFVLAQAYLDQLERSKGLTPDRIKSARATLTSAEKAADRNRRAPLTQLATQLTSAAGSSSDAAKVRMLAATVNSLAGQ
jgi:hypothetical protein